MSLVAFKCIAAYFLNGSQDYVKVDAVIIFSGCGLYFAHKLDAPLMLLSPPGPFFSLLAAVAGQSL